MKILPLKQFKYVETKNHLDRVVFLLYNYAIKVRRLYDDRITKKISEGIQKS